MKTESELLLPVSDYDLSATLASGQAFRWRQTAAGWEGIIGNRWVRLRSVPEGILAAVAEPVADWTWLRKYLQTEMDLAAVVASFPADEPMRASVAACRGLRLLRQEPWECLASFILSTSKQIVQIQQIVALVCQRYGTAIAVRPESEPGWSFPHFSRLAAMSEAELRACKMGFRAPNLLATARMLDRNEVDLNSLYFQGIENAREQLLRLPGVGHKVANCVLLFAYGFQEAFPVDVWVRKALRELYFPRRRPSIGRLQRFVATHFGPNAGYAQQYLFHYMRLQGRANRSTREQDRGIQAAITR